MHNVNNKNTATDFFNMLTKFQVGIGDLSEISGITQRQLRYWEQKGYISPVTDAKGGRKYDAITSWKVMVIASHLEEGYTLGKAVELTDERRKRHSLVATLMHYSTPKIVQVSDDYKKGELYIGRLEDEDKNIMCHIEDDNVKFYLEDKK